MKSVELNSSGEVKHIHLVAIGGIGMSSLAGMFKQQGYTVTGSDLALYPPASRLLAELEIPVFTGYRAENLEPRPDLAIIGNAISRGNPEAEAVLSRGLPHMSFPQALARFFLAGKRRLVVAGTHGKSTCCAMLAWVLANARRDPSFMVGAACRNFGCNFRLGGGEDFVVEGDEYDSAFFDKGPKFLHYDPDLLLLTAIEFDHADIYQDLAQVRAAFEKLMGRMGGSVPVLARADFPQVLKVTGGRPAVETFGFSTGSMWRAEGIKDDGQSTHFTIVEPDERRVAVFVRQAGEINVANALGVYAASRKLGLEPEAVVESIAKFAGLERRQELVTEASGVTLIDDFAHHPTAVAGTISALRSRYRGRRLWVLFEPRSNTSRRAIFQDLFAEALVGADKVTVGEVYKKDKLPPGERLSTEKLASELRRRGVSAEAVDSPDAIASRVKNELREGDVVVIMSNGAFGGLRAKLLDVLSLQPRAV